MGLAVHCQVSYSETWPPARPRITQICAHILFTRVDNRVVTAVIYGRSSGINRYLGSQIPQ
ncbi:hypothetical protein J6590_067515 [Homalodisca vitripennis]|nr:hypothetical protein J6590_067515 [Homalodisca vitripennis]